MAAPSQLEIANMRTWNVYSHYYRYRRMYVTQGRAVAAGIRAILQRAQAQPPNLNVTEDDIASGLRSFLLVDAHWMAYLGRKAHMVGPVHFVMTDTLPRFIASEAHADITR